MLDSGRAAAKVATLLSCPALVALCIVVVDRPAATFAHAAFAGRAGLFVALTHLVDPVPPLAGLGSAAAGLAAFLGWRPGPFGRRLIVACIATLVAVTLKEQGKYAFGRLWPETWIENNPSFIRDGAYGFDPFHGGRGWFSFPSGHTTVAAAPATALWTSLPRWRPVLALAVILVAVGLFGADDHFVGDIVAGLYLGAGCGLGISALLWRPIGPDPAPPAGS